MPSQKKNASPYDSRHRANLTKYKKQIDRLFDTLCQEAARLGIRTGLEEDGGTFSFDRFPTARKKADRLLARIRQQMESAIVSGTSNEWALSEAKNAEIIEKLLEDTDIPRETIEAMKPRNADALKAFQERRKRGLTLSDRVWNVTSQAMGEVETAIGISIATGMDAPSLSRKVRGLLNNPTEMWRRYYVTRTRTDGTRQREAEWRRKVVDEDGKVRFVKQPLSHPGRGVYRSSYRNALRLAVTETNMAYHEADTLAWQQSPACIGIEVALSNNHTCRGVKGVFYDICDELAGKYPKYFKFPGWHPFCRCVAIPITASKEEFVGYLKDMMADKDVSGMKFKGAIDHMPEKFDRWCDKNKERIERMRERGTLPYFIKDNEGRKKHSPLPQEARERRKEIQKYAKENLVGKQFSLPQIGSTATISNRSIKEWLNQPFEDAQAKNEALLNLQNLLDKATYRGSGIDKHDSTSSVHLFETEIGGRKCWIIVRSYLEGKYTIYSVSDNESILKNIKK